MSKFEAAVIGAGPTGLAAALALARMGVEVAVVAPGPNAAVGRRQSAVGDQRTTALMIPSLNLLKNLGAFGSAAVGGRQSAVGSSTQTTADCRLPTAEGSRSGVRPLVSEAEHENGCWPEGSDPGWTPIAAVRIADDRGGLVRAPDVVFRASELGLPSFGANVANPTLLAGLRTAAERQSGIAWVETAEVTGVVPAGPRARLELAEGRAVEATLAVAADGRNSTVRAAAGIEVSAWTYPQAAIATSFGHGRPHEGIVNE